MSDINVLQLLEQRKKLQKKDILTEAAQNAFSSVFATVAVIDGLGSLLRNRKPLSLEKLNYGAMIASGIVGGAMGAINANQHNSFIERLSHERAKIKEPELLNQQRS